MRAIASTMTMAVSTSNKASTREDCGAVTGKTLRAMITSALPRRSWPRGEHALSMGSSHEHLPPVPPLGHSDDLRWGAPGPGPGALDVCHGGRTRPGTRGGQPGLSQPGAGRSHVYLPGPSARARRPAAVFCRAEADPRPPEPGAVLRGARWTDPSPYN